MFPTGRAGRVAHGAGEIAGVGDFQDADAGVLLVFGAEPAVIGTTPLGFDAKLRRHAAWQAVLHAIEPADVGADEVVSDPVRGTSLAKVNANVDSGVLNAIQMAGIAALKKIASVTRSANALYQKRRDIFVDGLNKIGWNIPKPKATFYVWAPVFGRHTSVTLAQALLDKADVIATPGNGFGASGEGYIRMALTVDVGRLKEAVARIAKIVT